MHSRQHPPPLCSFLRCTALQVKTRQLQEDNPYLGVDCNDVGTNDMRKQVGLRRCCRSCRRLRRPCCSCRRGCSHRCRCSVCGPWCTNAACRVGCVAAFNGMHALPRVCAERV